MHTARQLDQSLFDITVAGVPASRDELFESWGPLDRFGLVAHEGFGTIGASHLLQLAITAFYDIRPERRDRSRPIYPDVFVFHVGGRFGDHAFFDVYPPRKEVFVENEPAAILNAINDRGITHLAVPDRPVDAAQQDWKEPAQAIDRIVATWAYGADGEVDDPDVTITASSPMASANAKIALDPKRSYHEQQQARAALGNIVVGPNEKLVMPPDRSAEVTAERREAIWESRVARSEGGTVVESYRRIAVEDALGMLHRGEAPPFERGVAPEEAFGAGS